MSPLNRYRKHIQMSIVTLLVVWPVVHIFLTSLTSVNSWKLGGWGMYASTPPNVMGLKIFLFCQESEAVPEIGDLLLTARVRVVRDGELVRLSPQSFESREAFREMVDLIEIARILGRESDLRAFAAHLEPPASRECQGGTSHSLLLVGEPRLDPGDAITYTLAWAYLHRRGQLEQLGDFDSRQIDAQALREQLDQRVRQVLSSL